MGHYVQKHMYVRSIDGNTTELQTQERIRDLENVRGGPMGSVSFLGQNLEQHTKIMYIGFSHSRSGHSWWSKQRACIS